MAIQAAKQRCAGRGFANSGCYIINKKAIDYFIMVDGFNSLLLELYFVTVRSQML